jgi:glycosyltransferase involved in cell wall biosynthesis
MVSPFPSSPGRIFGGVAGAAKYLTDELAKLPGLSVSVVVPQGAPGDAVTREDWAGVSVYRLPKEGPWRRLPGTVYDLAAGRAQLERRLHELQPDVVHFQGTALLAADCARRSVLTIHGIAEKDALFDARRSKAGRWLKRGLLSATEDYGRRRAPNIILISEAARAFLPPDPARRVWRIDNPVADSFFALERGPVPGRVFCCSRVTPLKNLLGMVAAFSELSRRVPGAELRVAGDGDADYLAACRAEARRRGVAGAVHFLGGLTVAQVQRELSQAACFALPSFQENAPLSLAEAMAAGVPAVAARVGGVPEMVAPDETGLLVDSRDASGMACALEALLKDPERAAALGRRARRTALSRHKASEVARRTAEVYRAVAGGR